MEADELERARRRLIEEIEADAKETAAWTGRMRLSDRVMAAIARVPRHAFVRPEDTGSAYLNRPLPIGHGQTISQPFMVAVMTDLLDLEGTDRVLEIGTGCGYQTAVLAELAGQVYSVECVEALAREAEARLKRLGYANVHVRCGDGHAGWPEAAPFQAIMVTAAAREIPEALVAQLAPGGRMVVPVGRPRGRQNLYVGVKEADGAFRTERTLPVAFVPLVHRPGAERRFRPPWR